MIFNSFQIRKDELSFKVVRHSFRKQVDGTIQCVIKCPCTPCTHLFPVFYKSYKSSYKPIKKAQSQLSRPMWHLAGVQKHILSDHAGCDIEQQFDPDPEHPHAYEQQELHPDPERPRNLDTNETETAPNELVRKNIAQGVRTTRKLNDYGIETKRGRKN